MWEGGITIGLVFMYDVFIGGGAGGQRGQLPPPPLADKGGKRYQIPPFRRLSGMMPASTDKNIGLGIGENV